jgi:hypothetical protein
VLRECSFHTAPGIRRGPPSGPLCWRQPGFDRCVSRVEGYANESNGRRNIHDSRVATFAQRRKRFARKKDRRHKVDLDHCLDLGDIDLVEAAGADVPSFFDEDVEMAEARACDLNRCASHEWAGDIADHDLGNPPDSA